MGKSGVWMGDMGGGFGHGRGGMRFGNGIMGNGGEVWVWMWGERGLVELHGVKRGSWVVG